ncbi:cell wall-active antibiotics response protein LiaF [Cohnella silvisoli]|uniref:Cell wall-active antibiotics response protein LiaF n=1 Tax=Cohnella silvisoli TaxID=2873699 RepID=A0ABV1KWW3_9BACL|nr:cell wall-active antibiotics response protein LiaF [Cohnella silvisoli]MCD9023875.1 cell wall-active antibiotics response protein [Cohnella silvisoli]
MKWSNNAILFIAAGIYLALGSVAGYATVNAVVLLLLGIERYRGDRSRISIIVIAISTLVLIINQFALFAVVVLVSLGTYYFRARPPAFGTYVNKHKVFLNMRLDEQSWVLHSMSFWHAIGEIRMDMSLAVPEDKETTIVLQGLVGDLDLIVPDDYGLQVEASVLLGQISFKQMKEGGMFHRLSWRSPNYEDCEQKLKLQLFYLVGDIKIRTV